MSHKHKNEKNNQKGRIPFKEVTIVLAFVLLFFGALFVIGKNTSTKEPGSTASANNDKGGASPLAAPEKFFDFGAISMKNGTVTHEFLVKNPEETPVTLSKLYTSCMCTTARIMRGEKEIGPYGMPGHGFVPTFSEELKSGEEARVAVIFDPAAHGPSGIGAIEREVYIEQKGYSPLTLRIKAIVTP